MLEQQHSQEYSQELHLAKDPQHRRDRISRSKVKGDALPDFLGEMDSDLGPYKVYRVRGDLEVESPTRIMDQPETAVILTQKFGSGDELEGLVGKLDITPQFLREKARKRQLQQLETALSLLITVE